MTIDFTKLNDPVEIAANNARREKEQERVNKAMKEFKSTLEDMWTSHRLTTWEKQFVNNLRSIPAYYTMFDDLTDKQKVVYRRIEAKIYAVG